MTCRTILLLLLVGWLRVQCLSSPRDLARLKKDETVADFRVVNLYAGSDSQIVGVKLRHRSGAPVYLLTIQTVPQVFMWVDTPTSSNMGIPHALEHLLALKGTKGRYCSVLTEMRFSRSSQATSDDFNFYSFSSGTGLDGFFEEFHAWLDALYKPDFADIEAESEFYHFGVSEDAKTKKRALSERGTVYDEMQAGQGVYAYSFELNKRVFGDANPFAFDSGGVPDEMRQVTPSDIRRFHAEHYRLGPTTGFVFALDPKENIPAFLARISVELNEFSEKEYRGQPPKASAGPKYPIRPSADREIRIYPFPSDNATDRGDIRFAWKPVRTESQSELKLLQLFFKALGEGDKSLLYKSLIDSKTRGLDSGGTEISGAVFLQNSPYFPVEFVGLYGIPGDRMTTGFVERLRTHLTATIQQIAEYPDNSQALAAFNELALLDAKASRRSERAWTRSSPQFGLNYKRDWKEYLEYLEMDPSFVRSISEEPVWREVERTIKSGKNVWQTLIQKFGLLEAPYAAASVPSPQLLRENEQASRKRIAEETAQLMNEFGVTDEQQALALFAEQEARKMVEIDRVAGRVARPKFATSPPLTPDDDLRYEQFRLGAVPVTASLFDGTPTIDLGLSFDLRRLPRKYYKYLPILPRCLDSLGLRTAERITPYGELLAQTEIDNSSIQYEFNPVSRRADLTIRASVPDLTELGAALKLIQQMIDSNNLWLANGDRLRDVVERRLQEDDAYIKGGNEYPFMNLGYAFRYQTNPLYVALSSVVTRTHWDGRLTWLLHQPVSSREMANLAAFAENTIPDLSGLSREEVSKRLARTDATGLDRELLRYWERHLSAFPEAELTNGFRRLTLEVLEDLRVGPEKAIAEIRELQRLVLTQDGLNVDLTLDPSYLVGAKKILANFLNTLPVKPGLQEVSLQDTAESEFVVDNIRKRYSLPTSNFPWFLGLEDSRSATASMVFSADHPGYSQLDRRSLEDILSANLLSGSAPHTFFSRALQDGLAYSNGLSCDPSHKRITYFAQRSPDIVALMQLVNLTAVAIPAVGDQTLVDYSLQQSLPVLRSMATFSERGADLAKDLRDGNDLSTVRRFSRAILQLRGDPNLLNELSGTVMDSVGSVLVSDRYISQQRKARALFLFVGPERLLADAEKRLSIPRLLRVYPSDFWIDY